MNYFQIQTADAIASSLNCVSLWTILYIHSADGMYIIYSYIRFGIDYHINLLTL